MPEPRLNARAKERIAARLVRHRLAADLTQVQLAELIGVTQPTISAWEAGRLLPSPTSRADLCDVFEVRWDELFREIAAIDRKVEARAILEAER